jgi:hypothetical protein
MAFLGQAAVAMWWNMAAGHREEFERWHSHEHFPERMGIPGFLCGSRWSSAGVVKTLKATAPCPVRWRAATSRPVRPAPMT